MKVKYEIVNKRRNEILEIIKNKKKITVDEIVEKYNISSLTARRDLQVLEDSGYIVKFHGGAKIDSTNNFGIEENKFVPIKIAIAKKAAELIEDGDTIFINTSSTALLVVQYIENKRVTVITNNAKALYIKHSPLVSIYLTGGELRFPKETLVGEFALNNINKVSANKAILGCSGIDPISGVTTAILQEVPINETMISRSSKTIILAEAKKIGYSHNFISSDINKVDVIITDEEADKKIIDKFSSKNIECIIVSE